MNNRTISLLGAVVLLSVTGSIAQAQCPSCSCLIPATASKLITLVACKGTGCSADGGDSGGCAFGIKFDKQQNPNGTQTVPFAGVPSGQVLVITDLEWNATGVTASNRIRASVTAQTSLTVFSTLLNDSEASDSGGRVGGSISSPHGSFIKSGKSLCFNISTSFTTEEATIHGFLAPDS